MDEFDDDVCFRMSKWTELIVIAALDVVRVEGAEFSFVIVVSIELLYSIVCFGAIVSIWTLLIILYVGA